MLMAASPLIAPMLTNFSTSRLKRKQSHLVTLTVAVCLFCFALAQGASQLKAVKRITGLHSGETVEGSRVTVTADGVLDDYEAFRRGDRFYVRIPSAEFTASLPRLHGDGFEDLQVQKLGDGVVISFKLQPGASARVNGGSNQLEVVFFSPSRTASLNDADANAVRSRTTRKSGVSGTSVSGSTPRRGTDNAGPMPPDSPTVYTPGAQESSSAYNAIPRGSSALRGANRRESTSADVLPSNQSAVVSGTPNPNATPYAASAEYSSTYPPATTVVTPPVESTKPTAGGTNWRGRAQAGWHWLSMNRVAAVVGGCLVLALLGVIVFVLLRRRRTARRLNSKAPRVQPKYSPDVQLEDMLVARVSSDSAKVAPGGYVDEETYENWDVTDVGSDLFSERITDPQSPHHFEPEIAPEDFEANVDESWVFTRGSETQTYQGRLQEEREVFEL